MSNFEKLAETAILPIRSTKKSAGYDLYANEPAQLFPNERVLIKTGVTCAMEDNEYLAIVPRSGLVLKQGLTVLNSPGTIDADYYPNEIGVILYNASDNIQEIKLGDRIAQAILCEYKTMGIDNVKDAKRTSGFGSTGMN